MRMILLATLATSLVPWTHAADIGLTPPRLDLWGAAATEVEATATVFTTAATYVPISIDRADWFLNLAGSISYVPAGSSPYSAATWLVVEAGDFVLEPGSERSVRVTATVPPDAEGTYHTMVLFTVAAESDAESGVGVATTTRVGLTVYVTVAGTERDGSELVDMYQSGERTIAAVILNTGNTVMRLGGVVEIRDEAGDVVRRLDVPDVPVLRESERELAFALPDDLPSGFYVALALIEDSRGGVLAGELPFDLP